MESLTVIIGNSDDKLTQQKWSSFYKQVELMLAYHCEELLYAGSSIVHHEWQDAIFVGEITDENLVIVRSHLASYREQYNQNAMTIIVGEIEFI